MPRSTSEQDRREFRRAAIVTGIAVVVAASSVLAALGALHTTVPSIEVTAVYFTSSDNVCNASKLNWTGYSTGSGGSYELAFPVTNPSYFVACTITSVRAVTPGFRVAGPSDLPLTIPAATESWLEVTIVSPAGTYHGNLTLDAE